MTARTLFVLAILVSLSATVRAEPSTLFLFADTMWAANTTRCGLGEKQDGPFYMHLADRKAQGFTAILMHDPRRGEFSPGATEVVGGTLPRWPDPAEEDWVLVVNQPSPSVAVQPAHVWKTVEITLRAETAFENPFTDAQVWVDLKGPGFEKRCYGLWDGGDKFRVRVLATAPGQWTWRSGSQPDAGLNGKTGEFEAVPWSDAEKQENPNRRGMIRATTNGHAFEYADGTPFFLLGDTWWATPTFRFPWRDDDTPRALGLDAGFKDYVRLRREQGFNSIAILACRTLLPLGHVWQRAVGRSGRSHLRRGRLGRRVVERRGRGGIEVSASRRIVQRRRSLARNPVAAIAPSGSILEMANRVPWQRLSPTHKAGCCFLRSQASPTNPPSTGH